MKRTTYPYLLADFYDASQFEILNFANHANVISIEAAEVIKLPVAWWPPQFQ